MSTQEAQEATLTPSFSFPDNEKATALIERIKKHLENDGQVLIFTYTKYWVYKKKHVEMFRARGIHPEVKVRDGIVFSFVACVFLTMGNG